MKRYCSLKRGGCAVEPGQMSSYDLQLLFKIEGKSSSFKFVILTW